MKLNITQTTYGSFLLFRVGFWIAMGVAAASVVFKAIGWVSEAITGLIK